MPRRGSIFHLCLRCSEVYANYQTVLNLIIAIIYPKLSQLIAEVSERHCNEGERAWTFVEMG